MDHEEDFLTGVMDWDDGDDEVDGLEGSEMLHMGYPLVMPHASSAGRGGSIGSTPVPEGFVGAGGAEAYNGGGGTEEGEATTSTAAKKRKRSVLTQEERAKQNRDRNREHARNTRLRKKKFVEDLKDKVNALATAREKEERDKKVESARHASIKNTRAQVLQVFLQLRGLGEINRNKWESILAEEFSMVHPTTPYRTYDPSELEMGSGMRVISGVQGVLRDMASLRAFGKSLCGPVTVASQQQQMLQQQQQQQQQQLSKRRGGLKSADLDMSGDGGSPTDRVCFLYELDGELLGGEGDTFMCTFKACSVNAVAKGAAREIDVTGTIRSSFVPRTHKLAHVELVFDVNRVMEQIGHKSLSLDTLNTTEKGDVVPPGRTSSASSNSSGSSRGGLGRGAELENTDVLKSVIDDIRARRVSSTVVDSPDDSGRGCGSKDYLRLYPLNNAGSDDDSGGVTHFVGVLKKIDNHSPEDEALLEARAAAAAGGGNVGMMNGNSSGSGGGGGGGGNNGMGAYHEVKTEDFTTNHSYGFAFGNGNGNGGGGYTNLVSASSGRGGGGGGGGGGEDAFNSGAAAAAAAADAADAAGMASMRHLVGGSNGLGGGGGGGGRMGVGGSMVMSLPPPSLLDSSGYGNGGGGGGGVVGDLQLSQLLQGGGNCGGITLQHLQGTTTPSHSNSNGGGGGGGGGGNNSYTFPVCAPSPTAAAGGGGLGLGLGLIGMMTNTSAQSILPSPSPRGTASFAVKVEDHGEDSIFGDLAAP